MGTWYDDYTGKCEGEGLRSGGNYERYLIRFLGDCFVDSSLFGPGHLAVAEISAQNSSS